MPFLFIYIAAKNFKKQPNEKNYFIICIYLVKVYLKLMKTKLLLTFFIGLILFNARAQNFSDLRHQAEEAFNNYELTKAIELAEQALKLAASKKNENIFDYAEIKNDLGVYYSFNNNTEKGFSYIEESNEVIKKIKGEQSKEYIEKLNTYTSVCYMLSHYQKALEISEKSVVLSRAFYGDDHSEYGYALNSKGMVLVVLGNYQEAETAYLKAIEIFEKSKRSEEYASALTNIGDLYISLGEYNAAEESLLKAVKYFQKIGETSSKSYSDCLFTLGKVYKMIGDYDNALAYYTSSGDVLKKLYGESHQEYATTLSAKANVYEDLGKYIEAEELYVKAIEIKKETIGEEDLSYFITSNNLANLYITLNRITEAQNILEPIVINAAAKAANFPLDYVSFGSNLALVYQHLGLLSEAATLYENLLTIQEAILGKDHFDNVIIINNMATLKIEQNKFSEADLLFEECLKILEAKQVTNSKDYVDILYMKGLNLMNMEKYTDAKDYLVKAVQKAATIYGKYHKMYATININIGYLLHKNKEPEKAAKYFVDGMNTYQQIINERISFMSSEEKELLKSDIQLHFSFFKQFVLDNSTPELLRAFYNYQLMLKSMIIDSKIKVRKEILASNNNELQQLFDQWTSTREMLNRLYSFSSQDLLNENVNIDSIAAYAKSLENKMALKSTLFNSNQKYQSITWKDIQQKLTDNEAAIEIIRTAYYGEDDPIPIKYVALILTSETKDAPEMVVLNEGRKMENEWSDDFYGNLFNKKEDVESYNYFWSPIAEKLSGKEKLYVSRTGIYHVLNISTFMNPTTKNYVLDENEIVLVGSTKDVVEMKKQGEMPIAFTKNNQATLFGYPNYYLDIIKEEGKKNELLAMANIDDRSFKKDFELLSDLPGTKTEVENINQILTDANLSTVVYLEDEATESKLKNLKNTSVLHIATHGFFDWQYEQTKDNSRADRSVSVRDPLYRSGLMMAGSGFVVKLVEGKMSLINNLEDGVLSAYEVINMDLSQTELVVLSACLSGIGETKVKETESFAGLPQAFIIAGAKAVVTSGWSVDDTATQELMTLFYSNLAKKMPKRKALREAQIELKKKFPEPFYWGPFSMVGQ